jgi:hypothetical protein
MTTGTVGAPGTGAAAGGGAGSGGANSSGAVNYATTTDDQILDQVEDTDDAGEGTQGEPEVVSIDDDNQVAEPADGGERQGNEGDDKDELEGEDGKDGKEDEDELEDLGDEPDETETPDPAEDPADLKAALQSSPHAPRDVLPRPGLPPGIPDGGRGARVQGAGAHRRDL